MHRVSPSYIALDGEVVNFINLMLPKIMCEENLIEGLVMLGWPMGVSMGTVLSKLTDVGSTSPPWAAPFPRQEVLNCVRVQASKQAIMHAFISLCF